MEDFDFPPEEDWEPRRGGRRYERKFRDFEDDDEEEWEGRRHGKHHKREEGRDRREKKHEREGRKESHKDKSRKHERKSERQSKVSEVTTQASEFKPVKTMTLSQKHQSHKARLSPRSVKIFSVASSVLILALVAGLQSLMVMYKKALSRL